MFNDNSFFAPGMPWRDERHSEPEPLRSLPQSDAEDDDLETDLQSPMLIAPKFETEPA